MKKYKYFHKSDPKKEQIGTVKAKNDDFAIAKAAAKKLLPIIAFSRIFNVEEIKE